MRHDRVEKEHHEKTKIVLRKRVNGSIQNLDEKTPEIDFDQPSRFDENVLAKKKTNSILLNLNISEQRIIRRRDYVIS